MHGELDAQAVRAAARDRRAMLAMRRLVRATDAVIARQQPVCRQRGDCCRFESFGHRLFATTLEFAYFVARHPLPDRCSTWQRCPYQVGTVCTAREGRPVACRVFFCDSAQADWQAQLSERLARRLRRLHDRLGVPYQYREWLGGLGDLMAPESL
jgi:hypothetical protein